MPRSARGQLLSDGANWKLGRAVKLTGNPLPADVRRRRRVYWSLV
ncbi:MAG TPA: hypothetical protein VKU19_23250 [Bryobacteraceae bacterium]|nr:hypothetical protein [Bryobacteraceae bacterium]